jgi:hypothetical protein
MRKRIGIVEKERFFLSGLFLQVLTDEIGERSAADARPVRIVENSRESHSPVSPISVFSFEKSYAI